MMWTTLLHVLLQTKSGSSDEDDPGGTYMASISHCRLSPVTRRNWDGSQWELRADGADMVCCFVQLCRRGLPMSICLSVCPSVCLSDACTMTKRTKVLPTFLYHMKGKFLSSFLTRRMVGGGRPLLPEFFGANWPGRCRNGDFQSMFARSASALGPSEKSSIITNRKSTTYIRAFQWA